MNTGEVSQNQPRPYDSTLRQAQAERTKRRILDTAIRALAEAGPEGVTLAEVARRAGVSEPTLYRHFGSRDRLYEEMETRAQEEVGLPPIPESLDELAHHASRIFRIFGANARLLRAVSRVGLGAEMRARGRARRTKRIREMIADQAPHLDPASVDRVSGVFRILASWESFEKLTGDLGLSTEDASEAVGWATETLIRKVAEGDAIARSDGPDAIHSRPPGEEP